jgi:hypothetical protein
MGYTGSALAGEWMPAPEACAGGAQLQSSGTFTHAAPKPKGPAASVGGKAGAQG